MASPHRYLYQVGAGELHAYVFMKNTPPPFPPERGRPLALPIRGRVRAPSDLMNIYINPEPELVKWRCRRWSRARSELCTNSKG
jgi:hypothetical protein